MAKILLVDDEARIRTLYASILRPQAHELVEAENGVKALECLEESVFDLIITDMRMPDMNGLALLELVKRRSPQIPVILITAYASPETTEQAVELGVFDYLAKPFRVDALLAVVARALAADAYRNRALDGYAGANETIRAYLAAKEKAWRLTAGVPVTE